MLKNLQLHLIYSIFLVAKYNLASMCKYMQVYV